MNARVCFAFLAAGWLLACGGRSRFEGDGAGGTSGTAGSGGAPPGFDCSGTFAGTGVVLQAPSGATLSSPVLSSDERELFYVQYDEPYAGHFRRSTRASRAGRFPDGSVVPELDAACAARDYRSLDVSLDGLRAYIVCFASLDGGTAGDLRVAERRSPGEPFVLRTDALGWVGASPALSRDERRLYSSSPEGEGEAPRVYTRATRDGAFVAEAFIPGLAGTEMAAPEPSPDELTLFGAESASIVAASRATADSAFGAPVPILSPPNGTWLLGAPELSADCRSLYYVAVDAGVAPPEYRLMRVTR